MPDRLLIACRHCQRQFSVAQRLLGKRFRCHCGEEVEAKAPRGHDASIVVCSSCGAPREKGGTACRHCGSDFTLHEQDLQAMCPGCLARVSKQGRFCHHCGLRIAAEVVRTRPSPHVCAACDDKRTLSHRILGDLKLAVLECQSCAGLWIPLERFSALIEAEAQSERSPLGPMQSKWQQQTGKMYRPCIVCQQLMVRQHFGRGKSRVIVDICGDHGVWFDNDELAHILAWVRAGGARDARLDLAKLKSSKDRKLKREAHQMDETPSPFAGEYGLPTSAGWWHRPHRRLIRNILSLMFPGT